MALFYFIYDCDIDEIVYISSNAYSAYKYFYDFAVKSLTHTFKIYKARISSYLADDKITFSFSNSLVNTIFGSKQYRDIE